MVHSCRGVVGVVVENGCGGGCVECCTVVRGCEWLCCGGCECLSGCGCLSGAEMGAEGVRGCEQVLASGIAVYVETLCNGSGRVVL